MFSHSYLHVCVYVSLCAGESSRTVAVLYVLSRVPLSGAAGQEAGLGSQAAGTLPQ